MPPPLTKRSFWEKWHDNVEITNTFEIGLPIVRQRHDGRVMESSDGIDLAEEGEVSFRGETGALTKGKELESDLARREGGHFCEVDPSHMTEEVKILEEMVLAKLQSF